MGLEWEAEKERDLGGGGYSKKFKRDLGFEKQEEEEGLVVNEMDSGLCGFWRRRCLIIDSVDLCGTRFSNLYTAVDTPANPRGCVHDVCVFVCEFVLGRSRGSQPLDIRLFFFSTSAFSLGLVPSRLAAHTVVGLF